AAGGTGREAGPLRGRERAPTPGAPAQPRPAPGAAAGGIVPPGAAQLLRQWRNGEARGGSGGEAPRSIQCCGDALGEDSLPGAPERGGSPPETPVIRRLDHVAVAVRSIAERLPLYRDLLGIPLEAQEEIPGERVRVAILGEGAGRIELLEASGAGSPVERFIRERGEGIHHLCFLVDSV